MDPLLLLFHLAFQVKGSLVTYQGETLTVEVLRDVILLHHKGRIEPLGKIVDAADIHGPGNLLEVIEPLPSNL